MKYQLTAMDARVIGCLLEKQVTTPEQYPLSVNGVVTACNQKTNREPVMNLSESEVQEQLDNLVKVINYARWAVLVIGSPNMSNVFVIQNLAI